MHVLFIPYGVKHEVDYFLRELEHQNFKITLTKDSEKQTLWIKGGLRVCPFGVYDYVFPKEYKDLVLTTLRFNKPEAYGLGKLRLGIMRKLLKCKHWGKIDDSQNLIWAMDNVAIIPIGIREDGEITDGKGSLNEGWTHEAL